MENIQEIKELLHDMRNSLGIINNFLLCANDMDSSNSFKELHNISMKNAHKLNLLLEELEDGVGRIIRD